MINTFKSLYTFIKTELKLCFYKLKQMGASFPDKFQSQFLLSKIKETQNNIKLYPTAVSFSESKEVDLQESVDMIDTSSIISMYKMFYKCQSLQQLDFKGWNTSSVTNMSFMFQLCTKLRAIYGLENWNTSKVSSLESTFEKCTSLNNLYLNNWDTSSLTRIWYTFAFCKSLEYLDLSTWNTSKVTQAVSLFRQCTKLKLLDLSNWNFSSITGVGAIEIFLQCYSLRTIVGNHTLQDVRNGLKTMVGLKLSISASNSPLRFSSILALANGLADLTGTTAKTLTISSSSYNNMYNDDDTIPTAEVIAERQAKLSTICSEKNWNLAH